MSGTLEAAAPVSQEWKVEVYKTLGEKMQQRRGPVELVKPEQRQQKLTVELKGNTAPTGRVGKMLAERLLGSYDDRHNDSGDAGDCPQRIKARQNEGAFIHAQPSDRWSYDT